MAIPDSVEITLDPNWPLATVERAVDGDTIIVHVDGNRERLRYAGIDTPETVDPEQPDCFGPEATAANEALIVGKQVALEYGKERRDAFGRLLAYVYRLDGLFVNAYLVEQGFARVGWYPPNLEHRELFLDLQAQARESGRGLWGRC